MHAAGAEHPDFRTLRHGIQKKVVADLMKGHPLLRAALVVELKLRPIVGVLKFVAEVWSLIESSAESEAETVGQLDVFGRSSRVGAQPWIGQQRLPRAKPKFASLRPHSTGKDQRHHRSEFRHNS